MSELKGPEQRTQRRETYRRQEVEALEPPSWFCTGCSLMLPREQVQGGTHIVYERLPRGSGLDSDEVGVVAVECGPVVKRRGSA